MSKVKLDDTGERMVPEFHAGKLLYAEHILRYRAAEHIVSGRVVLDIASGSGYGARMLAATASFVYGFDASAEAVSYAQANFGANNVKFAVADATAIPLDDNSVDVVTTFETIEHIQDYRKFISEVKRVLKADGLAIFSTPNDLEFSEGNHFHLHEFEREELLSLLRQEFSDVTEYYQATWKYVAIDTFEAMRDGEMIDRTAMNLSPLKSDEFLYFYFLCSNRKISELVKPIAALGEHYSDRALSVEISSREEQIRALAEDHEQTRKQFDDLQLELRRIVESRTYKFSLKMAKVRNRFRR